MSSMSRLLSKADWLLVQEPEEPQRGYGETLPWLLIGSFVAGTGLFEHLRRADPPTASRAKVAGTVFSLAAMLTGILNISADASNLFYRRRRSTHYS